MNHHIIYKQKATVTVAQEAEAFAVQNEISEVMKHELPQLLQEVFDAIAPEGGIIRIDSLQLDLGTLPAHNITHVFKERVVEKIKIAIITKTETSESGNGVSIIRKQQSLREAFLYFLRNGNQPWFAGIKSRKEWETEMQQSFSKDDWQKIVLWLKQDQQQQPVVIDRLIYQFSDDFLTSIISHTVSFGNETWQEIYKDLFRLFAKENKITETHTRQVILRLCLFSFSNKTSLPEALYDFVKKGIDENVFEINTSLSGLIDATGKDVTTNILTEVIERIKREDLSSKQYDEEVIKDKIDEDNESLQTDENKNPESQISSSLADNGNTGNEESNDDIKHLESLLSEDMIDAKQSIISHDKQSRLNNKLLQSVIETEPQYISNAGIVLLHPFLEMYFAEFDLLHKRKFKDDNACKRAVLLLHYLATGETEGEEWNLVLQKMMCGLPFEETLPNRIEITENEKEESERLLQSVINYCPPFKNTSLAGLRSTFLQRDGRLEKKENGWLLTAEQKTVDILLDKLPWGFSTIKFPWLIDMINVDWC